MSLLPILKYPDDRLHTVAKRVDEVDEELRSFIEDMAETMYAASGIGLAATQVNRHERVIVIDVSDSHDDLLVLINPEITHREGASVGEEGCLSVPGIFEKVERSERISIKALDKFGDEYTLEADGLLSVCIQHEIDHLDGKVFVEYLSRLKQSRIVKRLEKKSRALNGPEV
jgi:peptide deformylase